MGDKKDILTNVPKLKEMPYSVPDGYFKAFKEKMKPETEKQATLWDRLSPILGMAAMFLAILTVGTIFMKNPTKEDSFTVEDYIVHSDSQASVAEYEMYESQLADAAITQEDIIKYLIYIGEDDYIINENTNTHPYIRK